ncbi:MAG: hypothetical protein ACRDMK_04145 [Gaiellaceae bacterium]
MRYDVRVAPHSGGEASRFEHEQDEPLTEGDFIQAFSTSHRVTSVVPLGPSESDEFDAIVEAEQVAGPAEATFKDAEAAFRDRLTE